MKVSICVPTWENQGYGSFHLKRLLHTISKQAYKNFNVVISDHSIDDSIYNVVNEFKDLFDIIYIRNYSKRGNSPFNTNNCILNADGDLIKIMFQDDFFFDTDALSKIIHSFNSKDYNWSVCGSNHTENGIDFYDEMIPFWTEEVILGNNTISSPSVLTIRNQNPPLFDENLVMLMDCEYYYRLYKNSGLPYIVDSILITNGIHDNQISSKYSNTIKEEVEYIKKKHF